MPRGQLYINGQDAFQVYGLSLSDGSLSVLMQPAPLKPRVNNSSRLENGAQYITTACRIDQREITLEMHIIGTERNVNQFFGYLQGGEFVKLRTSFHPSVEYKLLYVSCTQFARYDGLAKFAVRFIEPNPTDRSVTV